MNHKCCVYVVTISSFCYPHVGWHCYHIHSDYVFSTCQTIDLWGRLEAYLENGNAVDIPYGNTITWLQVYFWATCMPRYMHVIPSQAIKPACVWWVLCIDSQGSKFNCKAQVSMLTNINIYSWISLECLNRVAPIGATVCLHQVQAPVYTCTE